MKRVILKNAGVRFFSLPTAKTYPPKDITIPQAIKRSPTAVLEALAGTVGVDPTAPHYAFIDDPAMIPTGIDQKRNYYLAKEMGKRAARQLAEEWPTLFAFDRDTPELPIFRPEKPADPLKVDPTEQNLIKMINNREVKDSVMLYERMRSENIEVSDKAQLELFKLVCYYNGENISLNEIEEWHGIRNYAFATQKQWEQGGTADLLFETLPKNAETVSTMISGLCKHHTNESLKRARALYKEYYPKKMILRHAFDSLITMSTKSGSDAISLLKDMKTIGMMPNLNTWNSMLKNAATIKEDADRIKSFKKIFGEMRSLGVTPSLTSFEIVLNKVIWEWPNNEEIAKLGESSSQRKDMQLSITWLVEILKELESRPEITIQGADDAMFFVAAMNIATRLGHIDIAERIVKLYESKNNEVKMPAFTTETRFYSRYLQLFIDVTSSMDEIFTKYRSFVPRLVGVDSRLLNTVLIKLKDNMHWQLLRRVVEDGIATRQITDVRLRGFSNNVKERLLDVKFEELSATERDEFKELIKRLLDIYLEFSNFHEERQKGLQNKLHPITISELAVLLNRIGESEKAYKLLEMYLDPENTHGEKATIHPNGQPRTQLIMELFEDALKERDVYKAAICLEILSQNMARNTIEQLAIRVKERCKLTDSQNRLIETFVRLRPE